LMLTPGDWRRSPVSERSCEAPPNNRMQLTARRKRRTPAADPRVRP
jgi:hypothetical protein